jgi:hypothetical protein
MNAVTKTIAAAAILTTLSGCAFQNQQWHADCTVQAKDVLQKVEGNKDGTSTSFERRLSTSCGVFNVSDSLAGNFSSYDTWNHLEVGKTYDIRTGGYRVGVFSMFPTVLEVRAK